MNRKRYAAGLPAGEPSISILHVTALVENGTGKLPQLAASCHHVTR